jgi:hypothetical protein
MLVSRQVYMVLSPRSLAYANGALQSLSDNSLEALHVRLITDSSSDKEELSAAVAALQPNAHQWTVYAEDDLSARADAIFGRYAHLREFRRGHPCWRKITDPLLLSDPKAEMVLLDPDLHFPNRFKFEETPDAGVLLMWQAPNCLFPPEIVRTAMRSGIPLAHHVDIGVAHWRADADLDWLDWLIGKLGGEHLPRVMHIEAIVWAALAMRVAGGHLDPDYWKCWRRTATKRVMLKLGVRGARILRSEPWNKIKCFHAGGEAKQWLPAACGDMLQDVVNEQTKPGRILPFVELTAAHFERERAFKRLLQMFGYYQIFRPA